MNNTMSKEQIWQLNGNILYRPGNRLNYLGQRKGKHLWLLDVITEEGEFLKETDPDTGEETKRDCTPGEIIEGLMSEEADPGADTYQTISAHAFAGVEIRASQGEKQELVTLIRKAATDETWVVSGKDGAKLRLIPQARAALLTLAEDIERDGRGAIRAFEVLSPGHEGLTVGTGEVFAHQHRFIASKEPLLAEPLKVRRGGKQMELAARSSLELPRGMTAPSAEGVLQKMQQTLLKRKANGASLLKTHLYLIDRAYRAGGEEPRFEVALDDLLEAKGYKRQSHGDFHPDTYREEYGRIVTLGASWITLWEVKGKDKRRERYVDQTPYWDLRARRKLEEGDALGLQPVLLADQFAPIIKAVLMEPGLWWRVSKVGEKRIQIPRAILALPTDGKGNEAERIAVQLAATLAIWVRASQSQHAGTTRNYSVGALLKASGIKTRDEFVALHVEQAKRLRSYLAGEDGMSGALATLRRLGAFEIDIADERAFWASGRGWTGKFWESPLAVKIPDLGIARTGRKK